ncbi:MAG: hypothetical protein KAS67_06245, partial [Thermoplasmata archaeon]|nr:hypothetical protein [Thermoplasmata archaeon]
MKSRGVERSSWAGGYYKVMASAISISLLLSSLFMSSDFNTVLAKDDPVSPQSVITYTYAGVTQDGAHDAYFCDVDIMPPVGLNLNSMTEFSDTQYALVTTSDNLRAASFDPGLGDEIFVWSDIHINESPDTITEIVMTFEGQVMFGMEFQLWVYNRQIWTWEQLGLGVPLAPNTDVTIMRTISASLSDYVQDGVLSWGCYNTFNGDITSVDRMEVQITTTGGFQLDVISPDGGENWMGGSNQKIEWFSTDVDKYFINNETLVGPTSGGETGPYFTANVPVVFHVLFLFETGIGWYGMVEGIDYTFDNALGMVDLSLWGPMGANQYLHIFYDYTISTSISIDIYYTMNNGVNWTLITSGETNDGEYDWLVPMDTSDQCLVRIEATDGYTNELIDVSEDLFTIDSTSPFVKVNIPDGGETFGAGSLENITWTVWDNYIAPPNMIDIYYSTNNGTDWILISAGEFNDGHFSWNVPYIASDECLIRVNGSDMAGNPNSDVSNSVFTITITLPLVHVITPNSGEIWMGGSQQIIEWSASSETGLMPDPISIYYSINNGINWTVVATNESNDGQYLWTLPFATSDECLVMVIAYDTFGGNSSDLSNMTFTIDSTLPFVKVNLPNGGEVFKGGTQTNITWTMWDNYASPPSTIYIYYSLNNGADWTLISANEFNDGHYLWDMLFVTSQECLIRINGTDTVGNPNSDVSDNVFTIDSILPIVTVQSPNGGEALQGGSTFFINWTSSDNYGLAANNVSIYYSINGGLGWDVVATGEADDGSYLWTVPFEDSQDCMVKVLVRDMAGNENEDVSDGFFTIDSTPPTVWVISPDGGELWSGNDIHQIQWNAYDNFNLSANPVSLYYSLDNGGNWTLIAENEANDGSYDWLTPLSNSTECLIMITVVDEVGNNASDTSNGTFTFNSSPPEVIVFSPDGGEILNGGGQHLIEWSAFDDIGLAPNPISIYYSINNGVNWTVIAANEPNDGQYLWSIPYETSDACRVKVVATDISGGDGWDMSNDTFTIDSTLPFVKVNLPNGGEVFKGGTQTNITWTMWDNFGAPMNTIDIYYSLNNGADWTLISANELNDGHYLWDIPFANSEDCLVRINGTDTAGNVNTDQSDGVFTIDSTAPNVLVIYPNGNELLRGNDVYVIQWSASDNFGLAATPITMYYSLNNGAIWTLIAGNEANDGSYDWLTPFSNSTQCLIQIVAVDEVGYTTSDESNFTFTIDSNDPASVVDSISSYWHNTAPLTLTATVSDNIGISYVELWYRFSVDNISWGGWANQSLDAASPWSWSFDWPTGEGYYEFYSRARDLSGNYEAAPVSADTSAGYDITSPVSNFIQEGPYWHNDLLILLNTTTFDSFSGVNFVEVWIRHSLNNLTWGAWNHTFDVLGPTWNNIPYWWAEGPGYYEFYTRAIDNAGNYESAPATADVKHAYDPDGPITSALTIEPNPTIIDIDNTAWLNATIGNITFGSNIVQAEWYLQNGSAPGIPDGSANPMNPADGLWDAPMENITAMLDISGWTDLGTYELWVHGLDEAGNWGPWVNVILIRQSGVTQLAIIPPSVTMTAGSQISFTVQTQNETGFPANVAEDTIIFLTTSSAAGELREMGTANIIGQVTILAGTNSAIFDYYDTDAMNGPYTLTANSTGLSNGTAQVTVNPAVIDSIVVDPDPTTVVV